MKQMMGCVFSIEEFSVFDGPGIRTTVFLKGCPLRCSWCHNPEGQNSEVQIVRSPNGCIGCNTCIETSFTKAGQIYFTEEGIAKCPRNLLRKCGEFISSDELCDKLMKNERILKNGGGVTFSGGEPLFQSDFLFECLEKLKGRLHTAVQTSGFCKNRDFETAVELADYFLYDLKLMDDFEHRKYTGVSNSVILQNFSYLAKSGRDFVARIPLIPGVNDTKENIEKTAKFLKDNGVNYVELLPYNKMAGGKYKMLMRKYNPGFNESEEVNVHRDLWKDYGIDIKVE